MIPDLMVSRLNKNIDLEENKESDESNEMDQIEREEHRTKETKEFDKVVAKVVAKVLGEDDTKVFEENEESKEKENVIIRIYKRISSIFK